MEKVINEPKDDINCTSFCNAYTLAVPPNMKLTPQRYINEHLQVISLTYGGIIGNDVFPGKTPGVLVFKDCSRTFRQNADKSAGYKDHKWDLDQNQSTGATVANSYNFLQKILEL